MRIINIHRTSNNHELTDLLQQKLNPLFFKHRDKEISFITADKGEYVEISQPEHYEGFLFRIEVKGEELLITRSEHYADDINVITLQSALNELFVELAGEKGIAIVQEG